MSGIDSDTMQFTVPRPCLVLALCTILEAFLFVMCCVFVFEGDKIGLCRLQSQKYKKAKLVFS